MKKALITGITGQDGSYLADLCSRKATKFTGSFAARALSIPRASIIFTPIRTSMACAFSALRRSERLRQSGEAALRFEAGRDLSSCRAKPCARELRHSGIHRPMSPASARFAFWKRCAKRELSSRFYQASISEMFGKVQAVPQTRKDAVLAAQSVRRGESFFLLGDGELSRELRPCTRATAFCSITKARAAAKLL